MESIPASSSNTAAATTATTESPDKDSWWWAIGKGSFHQLTPKKKRKVDHKDRIIQHLTREDNVLYVPTEGQYEKEQQVPFALPLLVPHDTGRLVTIKKEHLRRHHHRLHHTKQQPLFSKHINWATTTNPDGVSIVRRDIPNQGTCGSCWASAALGSLEASAARHAAWQIYNNTSSHTSFDNETFRAAQLAEETALTHLSVQQLIDCDAIADQGCTGGNPILAFFFLHKYGVVTEEEYPYSSSQLTEEDERRTCKYNKRHKAVPAAAVRAWGMLGSNHENLMAWVLRHVGPLAVGINAADHRFRSYRGGIFDDERRLCDQSANHALLLVGYGEENRTMGDGVRRYWIARNSWGKEWGEGGYVRIARRGGSKGIPGVCGIARTPSVALGGFLLNDGNMSTVTAYQPTYSVEPMDLSLVEHICLTMHWDLEGRCGLLVGWLDTHQFQFTILLCFLICFASVWPLSSDCRRRRQRRRQRRLRKQVEQRNRARLTGEGPTESTPLVNGIGHQYGSNGQRLEANG